MVELESKENIEEAFEEVKKSELKVKVLPMKEDECEDKIVEDSEEHEEDEESIEEFEEPVSPPPCSLSEAPQLLMSQTIEVKAYL